MTIIISTLLVPILLKISPRGLKMKDRLKNKVAAAVLGLTQGIVLQYAEKNICANAILPGLMNTPIIVEPLKGVYGKV
jgi:hypothetical protein